MTCGHSLCQRSPVRKQLDQTVAKPLKSWRIKFSIGDQTGQLPTQIIQAAFLPSIPLRV